MQSILTIACGGRTDDGEVPFIVAPFPEVSGGDPRKAPTLSAWGTTVGAWTLPFRVSVSLPTGPGDFAASVENHA